MQKKFARKLQVRYSKNKKYFLITVPKAICERLGWREGDLILIEVTDSEVVLRKA